MRLFPCSASLDSSVPGVPLRGCGGASHFGVGLGTLILEVGALMLSAYVCACRSFRHLMGGIIHRFSRSEASRSGFALWARLSRLNARHGTFFWLSLFFVGLADLSVRLVASGVLQDLRFF